MSNQPVTCLPPPLPPKTKTRRTIEEIKEEKNKIKTNNEKITTNSLSSSSYIACSDQEEKSAKQSSSSSSSSSATAAIITTVNLNTVDLNIPDQFLQENQQLLTQYSSSTKNTISSSTADNIKNNNCHNTISDNDNSSNNNNNKCHVVKILINPNETHLVNSNEFNSGNYEEKYVPRDGIGTISNSELIPGETCIRISDFTGQTKAKKKERFYRNTLVNNNNNSETFQHHHTTTTTTTTTSNNNNSSSNNNNNNNNNNNAMVDAVEHSSPSNYFFNQFMSSGQMSPSDTLDSGTCSDLDSTPPPLQKNKTNKGVSVTLIGSHKKTASLSSGAEIDDSDDNESHSSTSSLSCDSLNCGKVSPIGSKGKHNHQHQHHHHHHHNQTATTTTILPQMLLHDIRKRKDAHSINNLVDEKSYEERQQQIIETASIKSIDEINSDMFYNFHLNEKDNNNDMIQCSQKLVVEDETFAGYKDLINGDPSSTIRSSKGTVRGVKNRVRAGIATFLQINSAEKSYKEKDAGKVVVYTTSMGIIRDTYQACTKVKQILRTLLVKFEERDVFMSAEYQNEIRDRMRCDHILVPQLYIDGQHCGDAETVERLNESGELRKILKPFKNPDACNTCQTCGGYRLLPCGVCNGSKKSVHRNHFTAEFVALKCMNCDENGLVKCNSCS